MELDCRTVWHPEREQRGIELGSGMIIEVCKLLTVDLFSLPIPIPPLVEQQRIVDKVDELMALCDKLEAELTTTKTESRRLLEAVLQEALTA